MYLNLTGYLLSHKMWSKLLLTLLLSIFLIMGTLNFLIDPYGDREIICENIYKPVLNERAKKYNYLFIHGNMTKYDALILGSSRVMQIIPSHIKSANFYNFGVHVANNAEKLFILDEWLKRQPLKKLYLGIDFYNFHLNKRQTFLQTDKFKQQYEHNYFSFETLKLSFKIIRYCFSKTPQIFFENDGEINYYLNNNNIENKTFDFSNKKLLTEAQNSYINDYKRDEFKIDYAVFDILEDIKKRSDESGVEIFVFITPSHLYDFDLVLKDEELNEQFNIIRAKLALIFGKVYDFSLDVEYNSNNYFFYDNFHYRSILGDEIINTIENNGKYGYLLQKKEK